MVVVGGGGRTLERPSSSPPYELTLQQPQQPQQQQVQDSSFHMLAARPTTTTTTTTTATTATTHGFYKSTPLSHPHRRCVLLPLYIHLVEGGVGYWGRGRVEGEADSLSVPSLSAARPAQTAAAHCCMLCCFVCCVCGCCFILPLVYYIFFFFVFVLVISLLHAGNHFKAATAANTFVKHRCVCVWWCCCLHCCLSLCMSVHGWLSTTWQPTLTCWQVPVNAISIRSNCRIGWGVSAEFAELCTGGAVWAVGTWVAFGSWRNVTSALQCVILFDFLPVFCFPSRLPVVFTSFVFVFVFVCVRRVCVYLRTWLTFLTFLVIVLTNNLLIFVRFLSFGSSPSQSSF